MSNRFSRPLILGLIATITASASYALIVPVDGSNASRVSWRSTHSLAIPQLTTKDEKHVDSGIDRDIHVAHEIQAGDTIFRILLKYGISKAAFQELLTSADWVDRLNSIRPGEVINLRFSPEEVLEELVYTPSKIETVKFYRTNSGGYKGQKQVREPERRIMFAHGTIDSSLFLDGKMAGLSEKLIVQLATIFAWDIDFSLNIHPDDQFTLIYEKLYLNGEEYDTGNILAAEFVTGGQVFRAIRYVDSRGWVNYYDPEGNNLRKAFLRTPVEYTRISSHFNPHRKHPVLKRTRPHKGVDYVAPKGTPVRATGDGKIRYVGTQPGFGHFIVIQHPQKYSTLYAHLLHFDKKIKSAATVRQGQVIGYVGKSGLASGYHLHYEFRVNGVHRDPLKVRLPNAPSIEKMRLAEFKRNTTILLSQLDKAKNILVAHSD